MRVLVTRPEPDAARTAARLAELGHQVLLSPLLTIEPVAIDRVPAGPFDALAATSANAPRVAGALVELDALRGTTLYAVGERTAEAARQAGFATVVVADGDVEALARLLQRSLASGSRVLHLAGEDRAHELGALPAAAGIHVEVLTIYRARAASGLSAQAAAALSSGDLDAVLHYSPRSAATFASLVERQGLVNAAQRPRHYCLSDAVAAPLAAIGVAASVAQKPNEAELFAMLRR